MIKTKHMDVKLNRITTKRKLGRDPSKAAGLKGAFTLIGPKDHGQSDRTGRARTNKAAFTLIELIVVMAVIAILVLLATPKFLNYTQKAKVTQIRNDIKVIENKIDEYLILHEKFPDTFIPGGTGSGQLYDRTGEIDTAPPNLKVVDKTFIPESNLDGDFFVDEGGNVIYEDKKPIAGGGPVVVLPPGSDAVIPLGDGTPANPYQIWFLEHLAWINTDATTRSSNFIVMRNLDFKNSTHYIDPTINKALWTLGAGWTPIGAPSINSFKGEFDGQNHTLNNLFINKNTGDTQPTGLFGYIEDAVVANYKILNASVTGFDDTAALAGYAYGVSMIENIEVSGSIKGAMDVGGVIGYGGNYGGSGTIRNSRNSATVTGDSYVGGIVGYSRFEYVTNLRNDGNIEGLTSVGSNGGIAGGAYFGTMDKLFNTSSVKSAGEYTGGIFGDSSYSVMQNIVNHGDIVGVSEVGGLIGNTINDEISNGYNIGNVAGIENIGGIAGESMSTISDSFALDFGIPVVGYDDGELINAAIKTNAQMKDSSLYGGWDTAIWNVVAGHYPTLK